MATKTKNETAMAQAPDYRTIVQKTSDALIPMIQEQMKNNGIDADSYQLQCMANAITVINDLAVGAGVGIGDIDRTSLCESLQQAATLRLNAFSQPRECYFITRKRKSKDGSWGTVVEMGIEGDGNETILRNFGHDVDTVYPYWEVREDDVFEYPHYHGIEIDPPSWTPGGHGKVARVVYPVKFKDGTVRYFIGEREDVRVNLMAHISNNLLNETFGIAENRYKATVEQKQQIENKKRQLLELADGKNLDQILEIPELQQYISPAWGGDGRERMIVRKMRNNVIKPIPKDFSSALTMQMYARSSADADEAPNQRTVTVIDLDDEQYRELDADREPERSEKEKSKEQTKPAGTVPPAAAPF